MPDLHQGENVTANWQSPANYARSPDGVNPVNPITLSVDFSDQTGCPNQTYRFWLFSKDSGTPLMGLGSNASLFYTNHFQQVVSLPVDEPVYEIRLSCTRANGQRYSDSDILESGNPAFTPRVAVSWQNPDNYTRSPSGTTPTNPITLSANFTDESNCPYKMYRFWAFAQNGSPVGGIGSVMTLQQDGGFGISMTASLPTTPVYAVRLACVDNEGNLFTSGTNLEAGNPAFTPQAGGSSGGGSCSGQNTTLCTAATTEGECGTCGGTWATPSIDGACSGTYTFCSTYNGNQSSCTSGANSTGGAADGLCQWNSNDSTCTPKQTCVGLSHYDCNWVINSIGSGQCSWQSTSSCSGNANAISGCAGFMIGDCEGTWTNQTDCENQPLQNITGTPGPSSLCVWDSAASVCRKGVCNSLTQSQCGGSVATMWNCSWQANANCCNSPSPNPCTSPQTSTDCVACGGTWTPSN